MEVGHIAQEAVINTVPNRRNHKMDKWLFKEALQITGQMIEMKGKGEKERCNHLNEEFQRRARKEKKASLEIKE